VHERARPVLVAVVEEVLLELIEDDEDVPAYRLAPVGQDIAEGVAARAALDGADEVHRTTLDLIKGRGGALLREKIVAAASARMVVIADESKWVAMLGRFPLPIEVVAFGLAATKRAVEAATVASGCPGPISLRRDKAGHAFVTDGGHFILDAALQRISDPRSLGERLAAIPGVVEHGLFIGLAHAAVIAGPEGRRIVERP